MADVVGLGTGSRGPEIIITCVPDSTFKSEIDALILAGTKVVGKLVQFTGSNNCEVTSPANNALPDGEILSYEKVTNAAGASYKLSCRIFHVTTAASAELYPIRVQTFEYESGSTVALTQGVLVDGTAYRYVDTASGGIGYVFNIDSTNLKLDVLM